MTVRTISAAVPASTAPSPRRRDRRSARAYDAESFALVVAAAAFVLCIPVATLVFWGRDLPISGRGSLGEFIAISGGVVAAAAFVLARIVKRRLRGRGPAELSRFLWFDVAALALSYAAIALLCWLGMATVMEHSFTGAVVFTSPGVVIAAAATAVTAYIAYLSGADLSARQLSLVLALFLVAGMLTAMLSSQDPLWWQMNLSALGMTHDVSALTFNLTLVVSGVIVTTIARTGTAAVPADTPQEHRRRTIVRTFFVLLGVLLACVGVFPVDQFFLLHNTVATGMAVAFGVLALALPWLLPAMPRAFQALGYIYVAVVIVLTILFFMGVYNLTAVELIASLLIFSWIIIFLRNVQDFPAGATSSTGSEAAS
ncbi:hypothetical protein F6J84_01580 [Microbacterium caowuchunii]|uniref:hypothetical protein n=1 Tax=Microbacterium caowuchunii TaxID=2614638 RepID=UPI0012480D83|nr:hypothetical protein [Microbacterium caowuchunii]QEV98936.1 hypothetical protein F6J84_01580 [Microbacterium caowuchunii]